MMMASLSPLTTVSSSMKKMTCLYLLTNESRRHWSTAQVGSALEVSVGLAV